MNENQTRQRDMDEMSIASDFSIIPESMAGVSEEILGAMGEPSSILSDTRSNGGQQPFLKSMDFKPQPEDERTFGKVIFQNIQATYGPDTDIPVSYVLKESITAKPSDRISLYKVGFCSPHDYLTYQWAQVPTQDHISNNLPMTVIFRANTLPKECGEFYQFCYMSHEGHIVGVSVPFQLVSLGSLGDSSLCQVEDEEEGLMVVRTHQSLMQDKVNKLQVENDQLQGESSSQFQHMEEIQKKLEDKTQQLNMCQHHLQALEVKMKRETSEKCELMGRVGQVVEEKGHLEDKFRTLERTLATNKVEIEQLQTQNQKVTDEKDQYMKDLSLGNEKEQKLQETLKETQTHLSQSNEAYKKLSEELLKTKNEHQQSVAQLEFWTSTATSDKNEKDSLALKYSTLNEELLLRNKDVEDLRKDKGELEERLSCVVVDLASIREEANKYAEKLSTVEENLCISEERQKVVDQDNSCLKEKIKELGAQIDQLKVQQENSASCREAAERIAGDLSARLQTAKAEHQNLALLNLKLTKKIKRMRNNSESQKESIMEGSVSSQHSSWLQVTAADEEEDAEEDQEKLLTEAIEGSKSEIMTGMSGSCCSGFASGAGGVSSCSQSTKELTESVNRKMEDIVRGLSQQIESLKVQLLVANAKNVGPQQLEKDTATETNPAQALSDICDNLEGRTAIQQKEESPASKSDINNVSGDGAAQIPESCNTDNASGEQQQVLYSKSFLPAHQTAPVFLPEITNSNNSLLAEANSSSGCSLPSAPSPTPSMKSNNNGSLSRAASTASAAAVVAATTSLPSAPPYIHQESATENLQSQNLDVSESAQPQNLDTTGLDINGLHAPLLPAQTHTARQAAVMSQFVLQQSQGVVGATAAAVGHDSDDEDFHSTSGAEESQNQSEVPDYTHGYVPHQDVQDHLIQCPMCSLSFQPGALRLLEEHINSHLEHVCPICSQAFQRNNQAKFEEHVHGHFEEGENDSPLDSTGPWSTISRAHLLEID